MRESFILANGLSGNDLRRSLVKFGINSCAFHVQGAFKIAKIALIKSGISIEKKIVDNIEQAAIVYSFINEIEYFKNASYTDACNLVSAFHDMRSCIVDGDELDEMRKCMEKGTFKKKNDAVVEAFVRYSNYIYQNDLIDADGIIREAIKLAEPIDADFICLKEFELNPLEKKLLEVVSDGKYQELSLCDIYKTKCGSQKYEDAFKAYGAINEVEHIIEDVYTKHKLDDCVIACTNYKNYSQLIYNLSLQYKIPVTFSNGVSISNSNSAKLLKVLVDWDNLGYHGVDSLYKLLTCEALDWRFLAPAIGFENQVNDDFIKKLSEYAGNLKISCNSQENDAKLKKISDKNGMYNFTCRLAKVFEDGIINFLKTYVLIREDNSLDQKSLDAIVKEVEIFKKYNPDKLMTEVIPQITNNTIDGELSCEGKIHVTTLSGLYSSPRNNVYICGLSANEFPGKSKENYLLLDSDLKSFEGSKLSDTKILDKIETYNSVLSFINSCDCNTTLSYSYFDLADLRQQNASSVLYKLIDNLENIEKVGYFDAKLSTSKEICEAYKNGIEVNYQIDPQEVKLEKDLMDRAWSFSAINTYFKCPRKFYLSCVLNVPEVEVQDPFEVLNAKEIGILAHKMMEVLAKSKISKQEFLKQCSDEFDNILINKPSLIESKKEHTRQEIIDMMSLAYDYDCENANSVGLCEQYLEAVHDKTGLKLHGFPDRVETDGNNTTVVDFKTGRNITHKQNDPESCLQALIYAYIYAKNNPDANVTKAEFRYLRNSGVISCVFDDESKQKMDELLQQFVDGIKANNFERCTKECKYCTYSDICLWPGEIDEEKEGGSE